MPVVVDRRRVELVEPGVPSQPYHHDTVGMPRAEAEALVAAVRQSVMRSAAAGLAALCDDLRAYEIAAVTLRIPPLAYVPVTIAQAHASYAVMCRADGMMYHDAVCTAARHLGLAVVLHDRGGEIEDAAQQLGASVAEMERFLEAAGETLGPPWRKEHRLAAASAIAVLATHVALSPGG
ncbi:hypothetical protein D3C83_11570 [compost metagenome]